MPELSSTAISQALPWTSHLEGGQKIDPKTVPNGSAPKCQINEPPVVLTAQSCMELSSARHSRPTTDRNLFEHAQPGDAAALQQ